MRSPRQPVIEAARSKLVERLRPGGCLLMGSVSQDSVSETSWSSKYLIRGGKWIKAFIAGHPAPNGAVIDAEIPRRRTFLPATATGGETKIPTDTKDDLGGGEVPPQEERGLFSPLPVTLPTACPSGWPRFHVY